MYDPRNYDSHFDGISVENAIAVANLFGIITAYRWADYGYNHPDAQVRVFDGFYIGFWR